VSYLLDSHVLLWAAADEQRLSASARLLIEDPKVRLVLSVASMWELALKLHRGRLRLPEPFDLYIEGVVRDFDLDVLPVHQHHVTALAELPDETTDPFDRMLVAQSLAEGMPLITADRALHGCPIETIW